MLFGLVHSRVSTRASLSLCAERAWLILFHGELLETGGRQSFQCLCAHLPLGEGGALRELIAHERLDVLGILAWHLERQQESGRALRTSNTSASCATSGRAVWHLRPRQNRWCRRSCAWRYSTSWQRRAPRHRWRSGQECSWPPRTSLHKPEVSVVTTLSKVEASLIVTFFTVSASDCKISSSWSSSYTIAQSASRTTSCTIT